MLDTGAMQSFIGCKLAEKLPATVQNLKPLIVMVPIGKIMVATMVIDLDMLIDNFIYI